MQYALGLIFPIASYALQIYPRIFNRHFGVDVWTMLIEAELIRKNNHFVPKGKIDNGFILGGHFDYPPLFLILLSFFPSKTLFKIQGLISPFFDALQNFVVFLIAYQLTQNLTLALISQLVYTLTPISALENSSLLSRSMGYLFFTLSFYFLILSTTSTPLNLIFFILGIFFSSLTLLTHKFATQSLFFITIFFTLFEKNILYLIALILTTILAVVLSKGYYIRVLKSHVNIILFWIRHYKLRFSHQVYGIIPVSKNPDLIVTIYKILTKLAPITLLALNIWVLPAFFYLLGIVPATSLIYIKMASWVMFFYILGVLVLSIKRLTPIGEGYRYLEMATVPSSILTGFLFMYFYNSPYRNAALFIFITIALGNLAIILFVQTKAVIKDKNRSMTDEMKKMFSFINRLKGNKRIMCIPHQITTMVVYNTNASVLVNFDVEALRKMYDFYPVIRKPISEIARIHNINYILLRETYAKLNDLKIQNYKIVFKSGDVMLIQLL